MTEQEKRERVIQGLAVCVPAGCGREKCPYYDGPESEYWGNPDGYRCEFDLRQDAISLLKAQEPKILTKEDFIDNPKRDKNGCLPVWVEYRTGHCGWTKTSAETMYVGMYSWGRQKYRYWTAKPSDEQRRKEQWQDNNR